MKPEEKYTKHYFKRISLKIGNRFDGFQLVEIKNENDKLVIEYTPERRSLKKPFSMNMNVRYETFFDDLLKIKIENWDKEYPCKIYTGHEWNLKLYFKQSIIVEKQGNNNFPDNFMELIDFFRKYYPEFNADINIRETLDENDLLKLYCSEYSGTSFPEVSIGDKTIFGKNSTDRRLDLVRIENDHYKWYRSYKKHKDYFQQLINSNYNIEIVEIKTKINRGVIGQIIVGEYMFKKKFNARNVSKAILYHEGDNALELFCNENNIKLIKY
jgi:sulfur relay (sulfurtransferase) DsrC/TusE family protein